MARSSQVQRERTVAERARGKKEVRTANKVLGGKTTAQLKKNLEPVSLPKGDPSKIKTPKSLSACVDLYEAAKRQRLAIQKSAEGYAELEGRLREHLIENVSKGEAAGVTGKTHRVTVKVKAIPTIEDEAAFMKYASRKGNEDLVVQRPNMKAIEERWESKKVVPGVKSFNVVSLLLNKL